MAKNVLVRKGLVAKQQHQESPNFIPLDSVDLFQLAPSVRSAILGVSAVVGSALQVTSGRATHTSITAALAAVPAGSTIAILAGTYIESVTVSLANTNIVGMGNATVIQGNIQVSANNCLIKSLRCTGTSITLSGNYNIIKEMWVPSTTTASNTGTDNIYEIIKEL